MFCTYDITNLKHSSYDKELFHDRGRHDAHVVVHQAHHHRLAPREVGIESALRCALPPAESADIAQLAQAAAHAGLAALDGAAGPLHDSLVLTAAAVLQHLGRALTRHEAALLARRAWIKAARASDFRYSHTLYKSPFVIFAQDYHPTSIRGRNPVVSQL